MKGSSSISTILNGIPARRDIESPHIIGPLLRGVTSLIVFLNFNLPLSPASVWDANMRLPTIQDIDDDFPPYFGILLEDWGEKTSYDFSKNQASFLFASHAIMTAIWEVRPLYDISKDIMRCKNLTKHQSNLPI